MLEAVRKRLLAAVDANGDVIDRVGFDPVRIGGAAEPEVPHRRIGQPRRLRPSGNGDADFVGNLRGEFVPGEGRDQAEHSVGNLESDGDQVRIAKRRRVCESVQPPAEQFDPTGIAESVQGPGMDTGLQSIASAQHPPLGAEMIQRRRDRLGFFGRVLDAHADKHTSNSRRPPVFLSKCSSSQKLDELSPYHQTPWEPSATTGSFWAAHALGRHIDRPRPADRVLGPNPGPQRGVAWLLAITGHPVCLDQPKRS